jgi:Na+/phosphate symporter
MYRYLTQLSHKNLTPKDVDRLLKINDTTDSVEISSCDLTISRNSNADALSVDDAY